MKRIVIIGAGLTGLGAALALKELQEDGREFELVLLEKSDRVGGQIVTERANGFVIEGGPDCFISEKQGVFKVAKKLGIEGRLINTNTQKQGVRILNNGKLELMPEGVMMMVPTKVTPFVKTKLISWPGKLRAGMDLVLPRRRGDGDESLASFVRRRFGREVLDKIAEPLVGGIHASDPETMSLKATFPRFLDMERDSRSLILAMLRSKRKLAKMLKNVSADPNRPKRTLFVSFKDGMQELTDALEKAIGPDVFKCKTVVDSIEEKTRNGRTTYLLTMRDGLTMEADAVIVTALCQQTADLVEPIDRELAETLRGIPCVSSATINLAYHRADVPGDMEGTGFLVPNSENRQIMASTWSSSKWPHRAPEGYVLIRTFVGGAFNGDLVFQDDKRIVKMMQRELKDIMGITADPVLTRVFRWKEAMPQYTLGHLERVENVERLTAAHAGLAVVGASYRGVGVPDCLDNGAEAAKAVVGELKI